MSVCDQRRQNSKVVAVAGLQDTWICALDLRLIRADRIVSLLVPVASGYGATSPGDLSSHSTKAIYAEIDGGRRATLLLG